MSVMLCQYDRFSKTDWYCLPTN